MCCHSILSFFFFFNDTATTEIYTLSLHDALPIYLFAGGRLKMSRLTIRGELHGGNRSEEHTSELQSRFDLVCRLLLEKKHQERCVRPQCVWAYGAAECELVIVYV